MALSGDLISQFVKVTNDKKHEKKETTVYGTTIEFGGQKYVKLDGSDVLTPVSATVATGDNDRVTVMIKNHEAIITGNMSSPAARIEDVDDVGSTVTNLDIVLANKVDTLEFNAEVARIDSLVSDNVTIKRKLLASDAEIDAIQADTVAINEKLTANEAEINALKTGKLDASVAQFTYATISALEAVDADIHNLEATYSDINTLIFGSASGTTIHTSFSNSVIAQLGDAQIKSAMIESLSASKITAGDIITNNVRVKSADGSLIISDETMQISDGAQVRVQIGKDASNDYSINVWDADGKLMFSKGGITDSAIKQAIIRNDMVSATANISATKLDINSLFTEINKSTKFIKSSRVYLDDKSQVLDVAFNTLTTTVEEQGETITSQGTAISVIQGQIENKIWQQDIDAVSGGMSTQFSTLTQKVDGISATVSDHTTLISKKADSTTVTAVTDRVSTLETGLEGFKSTVSDTYATKEALSTTETSIAQLSNTIAANVTETTNLGTRVSTVEQTASGLTARLDDLRIGEVNLLVGSKDIAKVLYGGSSVSDFNDTFKAAKCIYDWQGVGIVANHLISDASVGDEFTFSVNASSTAAVSLWYFAMCLDASNVRVYPTVSDGEFNDIKVGVTPDHTDDKRYSITFRVTQGWIDLVNAGGTILWTMQAEGGVVPNTPVYLYAPKLERGDEATDWSPAPEDAAATATDYLNFSSSGLVVGDHTAGTLGKNVLIDSEAVKVRTGETVNAIFGADIIELAKSNESATISMLNGAFKIYYDNTIEDGGFGIYGRTTDGQMRLAFQPVNENNNLTIGWGGYAAWANSTNLYGHKMYLTTNEDIILNPGSGNVQMDGNVVLTNGKNLFGKTTDNVMRSMAIFNASNQMLFGYGSYSNNEGVVFYDGNNITMRSKNDITFQTVNETVVLQDGDGNATYSAFFRPGSNARCTLGTNANRWYAVYASNATIQTSDIREKENIVSLDDSHSNLFDMLRPVQYNFINGNGRICYGLIAQDVIAAMADLGIGEHDLDLVHHDPGTDDTDDTYGLAYANLIALLIHEVQKLKREIVTIKGGIQNGR